MTEIENAIFGNRFLTGSPIFIEFDRRSKRKAKKWNKIEKSTEKLHWNFHLGLWSKKKLGSDFDDVNLSTTSC